MFQNRRLTFSIPLVPLQEPVGHPYRLTCMESTNTHIGVEWWWVGLSMNSFELASPDVRKQGSSQDVESY